MELKACSKCNRPLPINQFYCRRTTGKPLPACKKCTLEQKRKYRASNQGKKARQVERKKYRTKNRARLCAKARAYRKAHPDKAKKRNKPYNPVVNRLAQVKARYGLDPKEYQDLVTRHNNQCAICGSDDRLVVDHCHDTGKVRGLLCAKCNSGLGFLGDDLESLLKAVAYLRASA